MELIRSQSRPRRRNPARSAPKRHGATIVEFAVVAPLLFFMIFLYIEFDRYILTVHAMKEAARVGCRVAILDGATLEEVETE
ncbi:MAG: pilus assembly protein, partial [Alphaproteobacteria bacterium]|nr:pilus assembly protein [Alphaproteobacteria bacterium]